MAIIASEYEMWEFELGILNTFILNISKEEKKNGKEKISAEFFLSVNNNKFLKSSYGSLHSQSKQ